MLKIHCPVCKKYFLWTDDMPTQGKCPNMDCEGNYDIHSALKQNVDRPTATMGKNILLRPSCGGEISSRFTICRHCSHVVPGTKFFKESYFFVSVCFFLMGLSLVLRYMGK